MLKAIALFVIGSAFTAIFMGVMLFVFGQSQRVDCQHVEPTLVSCSVSNVVLDVLPLPGWKMDNVVRAEVEEDCSDGCTYRTVLITGRGERRPLSEVWTDEEAKDDAQAAQINDFILAHDAPALTLTNSPAAWIISLLAGLGGMALAVEFVVFAVQMLRRVFTPSSAGSGAWR